MTTVYTAHHMIKIFSFIHNYLVRLSSTLRKMGIMVGSGTSMSVVKMAGAVIVVFVVVLCSNIHQLCSNFLQL